MVNGTRSQVVGHTNCTIVGHSDYAACLILGCTNLGSGRGLGLCNVGPLSLLNVGQDVGLRGLCSGSTHS